MEIIRILGQHLRNCDQRSLLCYVGGIHLFNQNKQVNTKVYRSAIASVLKIFNPPTPLREDTIHNLLCAMNIQRPRSQEILPEWHLSVVLKALMKPPFTVNGSDKNISLELLSYKTAFLVALATGARGSELVALSRADHNLTFSRLPSGARHVSIWLVPKYIPKNARLDTIPKPLEYPPMRKKLATVTAHRELTMTKMVTASLDWALTWAVIELWPSRDWAVIILKMPWLSCDWAVTSPWLSCDLS